MNAPLRIGAVSFLNTVPLIEGLQDDPQVELQRDLPSRLADLLWEDRIEVGLIPVVEYLRGVGDALVPGIGIGSKGPVRTVKVFSRVPLGEARDIAVDRGSRSSVALLRVLLAEIYDHHPDLYVVEPRPDALFTHHETVLVIGDRADAVDTEGLHVYDLGEMWDELTGLPFVYAAWVLGREVGAPRRKRITEVLQRARDRGLARLPELAAIEAERRPPNAPSILDYWRDCVRYGLGEAELAGLRRFAELAARHDLVAGPRAVEVAAV